jgi:hypothetical protein
MKNCPMDKEGMKEEKHEAKKSGGKKPFGRKMPRGGGRY